MPGLTYAKFFPSDWRTGCLVLNLEEEGLYIRICMFMYDTGTALPDDPPRAARMLNVQIQKYEKVIAALIAKGKIFRAQGLLINERVQEELDKYFLEKAARSEAARKREANRRMLPPPTVPPEVPQGVPPDVPPLGSLGGPPDVPPGVTHKKPNEINASYTTVVPEPDHELVIYSPEARIHKKDMARGNSPSGEPPPSRADDIRWAFDSYNELARKCGLRAATKLTPGRAAAIKARLSDFGRDGWERALQNIERSAFLRGRNDRNFMADLDFMLQASSFTKLHDGRYGNGAAAKPFVPSRW